MYRNMGIFDRMCHLYHPRSQESGTNRKESISLVNGKQSENVLNRIFIRKSNDGAEKTSEDLKM